MLTHCGLVTPCRINELGQHCFQYWLVAWTNDNLLVFLVFFLLIEIPGTGSNDIWIEKKSLQQHCFKYVVQKTVVIYSNNNDIWNGIRYECQASISILTDMYVCMYVCTLLFNQGNHESSALQTLFEKADRQQAIIWAILCHTATMS